MDPSEQYKSLHGKIALLDADIIVHRSAAIAEQTHYLLTGQSEINQWWVEFDTAKKAKEYLKEYPAAILWNRTEDRGEDFALMVAKQTIQTIEEKTRPSEIQMFLSGRWNFRYDIAKTKPYKESRLRHAKPKYFKQVKELLIESYGAITVDNDIEPDDALGISSTELGDRSFICTVDKDLDQLRGWHYDWVKDRVYRISPRQADFNLFKQILTGDSTDDVPGIAGIGPASAGRILEGAKSTRDLFQRCWDAYRTGRGVPRPIDDVEGRREYFIEQAGLVYVLRYPGDTAANYLQGRNESIRGKDGGVDRTNVEGSPGCEEKETPHLSSAPEQNLMSRTG